MRRPLMHLAFAAVLAVTPLFAACSEDDEAPDHTVELGGVGHRDGFRDPLKSCTGCHGATLHGGSGPSCYSCHTNASHTDSRSGVLHAENLDCTRCHGPANTGGLGPACTTCHT